MKFIPSVLATSLGCFALANLPLACVSNTAAPPADVDSGGLPEEDSGLNGVDGGPPATRDAGPSSGDASGSSDASAEASAVDAAPQTLTLTVLLLGVPEPGIPIVFQDATGAVVTTLTTGPTGTVEQLVTAGSQVTAVMGTALRPNLVTLQGVAPGDVLTVVDTSATQVVGADFLVTVPAGGWDASATAEYVYAGSCQQGVSPIYPLYVSSGCESNGEFPLLAVAIDNGSQQELAYTYQNGNAFTPDAGLADGAAGYPLAVTRPWTTSSASLTLTATNPPSLPTGDGGAIGTANNVQLSYNEVAGGVSVPSPSSGDMIDDAGTQTIDYVMHPGFPDFVQATATDQISTSAGELFAGVATRISSPSTSQSLSLDLSTLPLVTKTAIDSTDGGTPSQPDVTWTSAGSLSAANGLFVSLQWNAVLDGGSQSGTWTILSPSTVTSVHAPALPTGQAAWSPPSNAVFNQRPRMGAVQASFLTGYAGLRAAFGGLPFLSGYQLVVPKLPVNGTIYVVGLFVSEG